MTYFALACPAESLVARSIGKFILAYIAWTFSNDILVLVRRTPSVSFLWALWDHVSIFDLNPPQSSCNSMPISTHDGANLFMCFSFLLQSNYFIAFFFGPSLIHAYISFCCACSIFYAMPSSWYCFLYTHRRHRSNLWPKTLNYLGSIARVDSLDPDIDPLWAFLFGWIRSFCIQDPRLPSFVFFLFILPQSPITLLNRTWNKHQLSFHTSHCFLPLIYFWCKIIMLLLQFLFSAFNFFFSWMHYFLLILNPRRARLRFFLLLDPTFRLPLCFFLFRSALLTEDLHIFLYASQKFPKSN